MSSAKTGGVLAGAPSASAVGRFTRVSIQTAAGEIEARLSEMGNWELRVRKDQDTTWRLACAGDVDCGVLTSEPVRVAAEEPIRRDKLLIEPAARRTTVDGKELVLANKEFELLRVLAATPDRVYRKAELQKLVWGHEDARCLRTLHSHVSRLRVKLRRAGAGVLIVNLWNVGYRFWDQIEPSAA